MANGQYDDDESPDSGGSEEDTGKPAAEAVAEEAAGEGEAVAEEPAAEA